jgi:hypothetical protein
MPRPPCAAAGLSNLTGMVGVRVVGPGATVTDTVSQADHNLLVEADATIRRWQHGVLLTTGQLTMRDSIVTGGPVKGAVTLDHVVRDPGTAIFGNDEAPIAATPRPADPQNPHAQARSGANTVKLRLPKGRHTARVKVG